MKINKRLKYAIFALCAVATVSTSIAPSVMALQCGGVETSILSCKSDGKNTTGNAQDSAIWQILTLVLKIMTAGVGVVAVGGFVWASLLYTSARQEAAQVEKAKEMMRQISFGLIAYALMYMLLNFLIPGGIFT
jgi:hypothetical protein